MQKNKTIDDLLEHIINDKIYDEKPGINETNFQLVFDRELLRKRKKELIKYQRIYDITMSQVMSLLTKETDEKDM